MRFSVVVCTYNYAHFLPDALRTLAAQTMPDFELLVVDDGSTDHTEEVVHRFASKFQNCVYLKKSHSGLADTRNYAIRAATGTHIAFLDADDLWSLDYLKAVQGIFENNSRAEIVCCNGLAVSDVGSVERPIFPAHLPPLDGPLGTSRELFSLIPYFCPSGLSFKKSVYERIGGFDVRFDKGLGDDVDWLARAATSGAYCVREFKKLFLYRRHDSNLTNQHGIFLEAWLRIYSERLAQCQLDSEVESYARRFTRQYVLRLQAGCSAERGRSLLGQALETFPGDAILRISYAATYFGLGYLLKLARLLKRVVKRSVRPRRSADMTI